MKQSITEILEELVDTNGDEDVKRVLKKFITNDLIAANGIMIIWTHGQSVDIDGSRFSETEASWALAKAHNELLNKGLSFK